MSENDLPESPVSESTVEATAEPSPEPESPERALREANLRSFARIVDTAQAERLDLVSRFIERIWSAILSGDADELPDLDEAATITSAVEGLRRTVIEPMRDAARANAKTVAATFRT
jgi:hypothetical protein